MLKIFQGAHQQHHTILRSSHKLLQSSHKMPWKTSVGSRNDVFLEWDLLLLVEKESRVNKCLNKFLLRSNLDKARRFYKYKQTNGAWLSWTVLGRFLGSQSTGKSQYFVKNLRQTRFRCHFWHNLSFIAHVCIAIK